MTDSDRIGAERRRALAAATVAEFARVGYEDASLNRIIREAGMSKSSFYHFVGSKAELFDTVVRMLIADVTAHWSAPAPASFSEDFWGRVDAVLDEFARQSQVPALQHLGRIFYLPGQPAGSSARDELLAAVRTWVEEVLRVGRSTGAARDDLPLDLQADVVFAVLRAVDEWALSDGGVTAERAEVAASAPGVLLRRLLAVEIPDER